MKSKKKLLKTWKLYPIVDDGMFTDFNEFCSKFKELLSCPVQVIQLRIKYFSADFSFPKLREVVKKAEKKKIAVILNDHPEMAILLNASGVHLGKGDLPIPLARKIMGADYIIGKTIRGVRELEKAENDGCDYTSLGPVFHSPLKSNLKNVPFSVINSVCMRAKKPVVAIGGINAIDAEKLKFAGIRTLCFMRYGLAGVNTKKELSVLIDKIKT